jgi:hypothetical protein
MTWQLPDEPQNVNGTVFRHESAQWSWELRLLRVKRRCPGGADEDALAMKLRNELLEEPTPAAQHCVETSCPELARYRQLRLDMLVALEGKAKCQAHSEPRLAALKAEERDAIDTSEDGLTTRLSSVARSRVEIGAELDQADAAIDKLWQPLAEARAAAIRALDNAAAEAWSTTE